MKTRNPNKIQKRRLYTSKYYPDYPDYTHPHMLHTSKSPTFSMFYAAGLFSSTKISFFWDLTLYPLTKIAIKNANE